MFETKLEVIGIRVTDVDVAKAFYVEQVGLAWITTSALPRGCGWCR
jgi:hypothetical protein